MRFPKRGEGYHPPTDLLLETYPKHRNIMSKGHNMTGKHVLDDKSEKIERKKDIATS